jgi:hypothetical protein
VTFQESSTSLTNCSTARLPTPKKPSNYDDFNVDENCYAVKESQSADATSGRYTLRVFHPLKYQGTSAGSVVDIVLETMKLTAAAIDRNFTCVPHTYPAVAGGSTDDLR